MELDVNNFLKVHGNIVDGDLLKIALGAKSTKKALPTPTKYPLHINPQCKPLWEEVITTYKKQLDAIAKKGISSSKKLDSRIDDARAMAILLFKAYCHMKKKVPFTISQDAKIDMLKVYDSLIEKVSKESKDCDKDLEKCYNTLYGKGFLIKKFKEKYSDIVYENGLFIIKTVRNYIVPKEVNFRDIYMVLKDKFGYRVDSKNAAVKLIGTLSKIIWNYNEEASKINVYTEFRLTKALMVMFAKLKEHDKPSSAEIIQNGRKVMIKLLKDK